MLRKKKMQAIILVVAIVLILLAFIAWWHLFFGMPNPPLSQTTVTVNASSTAPGSTAVPANASVSGEPFDNGTPSPDFSYTTSSLGVDGTSFTVELATSTLAQTRGLSYRTSLGAGQGMLFIFGSGTVQTFWMKDMHFPLDIIWISGTTVVGFAQNAPPPGPGTQLWELPIYASPPNTDKVLEVNAGTVAKYHIKIGDTVTIGAAQ